MDKRIVALTAEGVRFQVLSEKLERDDRRFVEDLTEWLSLEPCSAFLRSWAIEYVSAMAEELAQRRKDIKRFMDAGGAEAAAQLEAG